MGSILKSMLYIRFGGQWSSFVLILVSVKVVLWLGAILDLLSWSVADVVYLAKCCWLVCAECGVSGSWLRAVLDPLAFTF